jgi:hypothetical protein
MRLTQELLQDRNVAVYLGDGVYAVVHDGLLWLVTSNGIEITNEIALEPPVLGAFLETLQRSAVRLARTQ